LCIVLSNTYCVVFFALFVFVLYFVHPMLPVSLDYPLLTVPLVCSKCFIVLYLHVSYIYIYIYYLQFILKWCL
jgi:hypothetical protein